MGTHRRFGLRHTHYLCSWCSKRSRYGLYCTHCKQPRRPGQ